MTGLDEFNAALSRYLVWTKRSQGGAVEHRAHRIRLELYRQFRKIAKTEQQLIEEVSALGYEFKRRKSKVTGKAVSPEREVALRLRSLRYLSVSWIFKAWRNRRAGQNAAFSAVARGQKQIGEAIVATSEGTESPHVQLTSFLEGVMVQNQRRKLMDQVLRNEAADMAVYIARKHQEWLQGNFLGRTFTATGTIRL